MDRRVDREGEDFVEREDWDLNKPRPRRRRRSTGGLVSGTLQKSTELSSDVVAGLAEAVSRGFRSYTREITQDNIFRIGFDNGMVEGMVSGYASFFDELAATSRRVLDDLRRPGSVSSRDLGAGSDIDYDLLARLVVERLRGGDVGRDDDLV